MCSGLLDEIIDITDNGTSARSATVSGTSGPTSMAMVVVFVP
jgi:hypothetical protein